MGGSFDGPVKVRSDDGVLLTVGKATLIDDADQGTWRGELETLRGTGVAGKALVVQIETPEGTRGRAQLTPAGVNGEKALFKVVGLGPKPF